MPRSPRLAWMLLGLCVAGSAATGMLLRAAAQRDSRRAFDVNATKIEANAAIALKRVDDLAVGLATTIAIEDAGMTSAELAGWFARISAGGRYPGLLGFTYVHYVPGRRNPARFATAHRAGSCSMRLSPSAMPRAGLSVAEFPSGTGLEVCAPGAASLLAATRDSGQLNATLITLPTHAKVLNVAVPVFSGDGTPLTVTRRRQRILGWALVRCSLARVLSDATAGDRGATLTVSRLNAIDAPPATMSLSGLSERPASSSRNAPLQRSFRLNAAGRWILTVSGQPRWAGLSPDAQGIAVLAVGTLIGMFAFAVVLLLARYRARSEGQLQAIFKHSPAAIFVRDRNFRYLARNDSFDEMLGLESGAAVGKSARDVLPTTVYQNVLANEARVLAGETVTEESIMPVHGQARTFSVLKFPLVDERAQVYAVCGIATDISERKQMQERLLHLADHDGLTGVYNRRRLINELDRQLRYAARSRRPGALLALDVDNFKVANDSYGHTTGDTILRAVAEVLVSRTRETDVVARVGGDEFAVVLPEATEEDALIVAQDIRAILSERDSGSPINLSIGIATFDGGEEITADELLTRSDIALNDAREHGADQARTYTGQNVGVLSWVQRIRTALADGRLVLYGQPIIDVRTNTVAHHELLIRMVSEDGDLIPPGAFLPTAERFGLIHEIDRWVTTAGLRLAAKHGGVAINLSGYSIGEESIIAAVRDAEEQGLDPANVIFEITETAAMTNIPAARLFARRLNGIGCNLALDDFGTGFGSFNYVKHIPARYLKIDMEFVRELRTSATDQHIVKAIIQLAHNLGKLAIAEGVEDAETLEILKRAGVDYAQGFHLGRPRRLSPPTDFEAPVCTGAWTLDTPG